MAKTIVNPAADLQRRPRDIKITEGQVALLEVFTSLKKPLSFVKYPESWVLRHYRAGESICSQGNAGGTAYYLLTAADVEALASATVNSPGKSLDGDHETVPLSTLIENVKASLQRASQHAANGQIRLATARLMVDRREGTLMRPFQFVRSLVLGHVRGSEGLAEPLLIPNDGPTDIDYESRQAALFAGEVFGEISCMTRQPRSATVIADTDCFVLEFLRNILEQMQKDEKYKEAAENKYRERVLDMHLRQLSVFRLMSASDFQYVKEKVELLKLAPGTVLWDEGDTADGIFVVRNGIIQVVQFYPWKLTETAVTNWENLWKALTTEDGHAAIDCVRKALPQRQKEVLKAGGADPPPDWKSCIVADLNEVAKTPALLTAKETKDSRQDARYLRERATYPEKEKNWTGLQVRRANRVLFHILFSDSIAPAEPIGRSRILEYLGRGNVLGEIGLMQNQPRSATCVAFAHPDPDREATDVELVRLSKELFEQLAQRSEHFKREMQMLVVGRTKHDLEMSKLPLERTSQSRRVQELGLLQGQNLMLIDLDRCTRCGDCVQACIDTHGDGHSRLFLDGPQFGNYLVPSSCRRCTDPVCMIGCPVGSIQQGTDGEIRIRDWCIGCGLCAEQCPYDSIQMHDIALVPTGAPGWFWSHDGSATNDAWSKPSFSDRRWHVGVTPFVWGIELQSRCSKGKPLDPNGSQRILFRHRFQRRSRNSTSQRYRLLITSQSTSVEAFMNGEHIELTQDAAQKKRGLFAAVFDGRALTIKDNVLAISAAPPMEFGAVILDARVDTLAPESESVEEKLVTERAVVCDQCSSLSGHRHACVYACPHEAAMRINAWVRFPQISVR